MKTSVADMSIDAIVAKTTEKAAEQNLSILKEQTPSNVRLNEEIKAVLLERKIAKIIYNKLKLMSKDDLRSLWSMSAIFGKKGKPETYVHVSDENDGF